MKDYIPVPMMRENQEDDFAIGYMCLVDFECELGGNSFGNHVYPSLEMLEKYSPTCAKHCGVVEVEVRARKLIREPNNEEIEITDD